MLLRRMFATRIRFGYFPAARYCSSKPLGVPKTPSELKLLLSTISASRLRNVAIVAHVDHGKTTLSDALMQYCGVLSEKNEVGTYLDKLEVERGRGITIKAQTCILVVKYHGEEYVINLIDTPGHVDFSDEVKRSVTAADGAVILVDASQGVEAQTLVNWQVALDNDVALIPALSKLDRLLDEMELDRVIEQLENRMAALRSEVVLTSARERRGLGELLAAIIERVPHPQSSSNIPFRAYMFDAWHSWNLQREWIPRRKKVPGGEQGVLILIRVVDGSVKRGDCVRLAHDVLNSDKAGWFTVLEVGVLYPEPIMMIQLVQGQVGYMDVGMTTKAEASVGDTLLDRSVRKEDVVPVAQLKKPSPMVFAAFFPDESETFAACYDAIEALRVNDPCVTFQEINCEAFGRGIQLGFLGMLHLTVFKERLLSEFDKTVLVTPPRVMYRYKDAAGKIHPLTVATWKWKHEGAIEYQEPIIYLKLDTPDQYYQAIHSEASRNFRAVITEVVSDGGRVYATYRMPLAELVRGFADRVMALSSGYASISYDSDPLYEATDLVKIDIQVNKTTVSALATICPRNESMERARILVQRLRQEMTRGIAEMPIQALLGAKIIARETLGSRGKNVLAKIHAGDYSRKAKKLSHQKEGKKRIAKRLIGKVEIDDRILGTVLGVEHYNN